MLAALLTAVGLVAALFAIFMHGAAVPQSVTELLIIDAYAHFYMALIFASTLAVVVFTYGYAPLRRWRLHWRCRLYRSSRVLGGLRRIE